MQNSVYKIKDSIDIYLADDKYVLVYFMNTRRRKTFSVNKHAIHLLEKIDGQQNCETLAKMMCKEYGIGEAEVVKTIQHLADLGIVANISHAVDFPEREAARYARQINYFSEFFENEQAAFSAQKRIMQSRIAVFGCGAVGGSIALELVMAGVRNITLIDFDVVATSDISRHLFFDVDDIGRSKIDALSDRLQEIDSSVHVQRLNLGIRPDTDIVKLIKAHDFIVNTMDDPYIGYTSAKISRACVRHNKPHFIAGGFDAHLASSGELIIPDVTPCVECYAGHFKEVLRDWKPKPHPVKIRYEEIGGLASMALFSASYASIEIIKFLSGIVDLNKEYKMRGEWLFGDMSLTYLQVDKNPNCPVCGEVRNES